MNFQIFIEFVVEDSFGRSSGNKRALSSSPELSSTAAKPDSFSSRLAVVLAVVVFVALVRRILVDSGVVPAGTAAISSVVIAAVGDSLSSSRKTAVPRSKGGNIPLSTSEESESTNVAAYGIIHHSTDKFLRF